MKRLLRSLVAILAIPVSAQADPSPTDTKLVDLAFQTCLAYPDNIGRLKFRLDARLKMAEQTTEAFFLGRNSGKVWMDRGPDANYAVVILDNGRCVVEGDTVSIDGVMQAFAARVDAAKLPMKQTEDDPKGLFRGAPGHTRRYAWSREGKEYRIDLAGTTLPAALLHAEIALEPAK